MRPKHQLPPLSSPKPSTAGEGGAVAGKQDRQGLFPSPWLSQLNPWRAALTGDAGVEAWPYPWPSGPPESLCGVCTTRRVSEHSQAAITARPKPGVPETSPGEDLPPNRPLTEVSS